MFSTDDIARVAHEANRYLRIMLGEDPGPEWGLAPQWMRDSATSGVEYLRDHPHAGPNASHESWFSLKESLGWKYGPVKDEVKLEHPCMVPYDELPEGQKRKDALFVGIVRAML